MNVNKTMESHVENVVLLFNILFVRIWTKNRTFGTTEPNYNSLSSCTNAAITQTVQIKGKY